MQRCRSEVCDAKSPSGSEAPTSRCHAGFLPCGGKSMDLTSLPLTCLPVPVAAPHKLKDSAWLKRSYHILNLCPHITWVSVSARVLLWYSTFGEDTLTWTMMGASEVLRSWAGWLMVSASSTTSCRERANSKILSISLCTSADWTEHRKWSQTLAHTPWLIAEIFFLTQAGAGVGSFDDGSLTGVVEDRPLGERYVRRDACDRYPVRHGAHTHVIKDDKKEKQQSGVVWLKHHTRLTCRQTCAWGSQTAPSASCLLPAETHTSWTPSSFGFSWLVSLFKRSSLFCVRDYIFIVTFLFNSSFFCL